jgi:hypothetical protein
MNSQARKFLDDDPRPPFDFVDPGSEIPFDRKARCPHNRSASELIEGDGPVTPCRPCVRVLGSVVTDPDSVDRAYTARLIELHGDVVYLEKVDESHVWGWTTHWPSAEPRGHA